MKHAMSKKFRLSLIAMSLLTLLASATVQARKDDMDVDRLTNSLNQLAADPNLGTYAQADQALARDAINQLAQAGSRERPHALYIAQRRVDQAKAEAQLQASQRQLNQLDQENAQLQLERSRIDATAAQQQLEIQRMQYQIAQQETMRLQAHGFLLGDLVLHALDLQLLLRGRGVDPAALQLQLRVFLVELVELALRRLQLRFGLGLIDPALRDVERMRPLARTGLGELVDRIARQRLIGLGVGAEVRIGGELIQAIGQTVDIHVVLARLHGCAGEQGQ